MFEADISPEVAALVPASIRGACEKHVVHGLQPGGFVEALLTNNLTEAITRADKHNLQRIDEIVLYLLNALPLTCWGSEEKVKLWRDMIEDENRQREANRVYSELEKSAAPMKPHVFT
jgi:hypothetical protein